MRDPSSSVGGMELGGGGGGGAVGSVTQLKSTGFPAYDAKIIREMKQWGYKPYLVNGKAVPVCTAVTFIYTQR